MAIRFWIEENEVKSAEGAIDKNGRFECFILGYKRWFDIGYHYKSKTAAKKDAINELMTEKRKLTDQLKKIRASDTQKLN